MNENRISLNLTAAQIASVNQAIDTLAEILQPVLIALDAEDKKNMPKLGERSSSYAEKNGAIQRD